MPDSRVTEGKFVTGREDVGQHQQETARREEILSPTPVHRVAALVPVEDHDEDPAEELTELPDPTEAGPVVESSGASSSTEDSSLTQKPVEEHQGESAPPFGTEAAFDIGQRASELLADEPAYPAQDGPAPIVEPVPESPLSDPPAPVTEAPAQS